MKRNTFYALIAAIVLIEAAIFWWSIEKGDPLPSVVAVGFGIAVVYLARMYVEEVIEDERTQKINEKTAFRTLQITWIALFIFGLWMVISSMNEGLPPPVRFAVGRSGLQLLTILAGMVVVYVFLSFYYAKKYGE